jgi:putative DNA primase/helicase
LRGLWTAREAHAWPHDAPGIVLRRVLPGVFASCGACRMSAVASNPPRLDADAVRRNADLVAIASQYLKLKKSGKEYEALCPFHNDKNPSFKITPGKELYHCFGCKAGGDVFDLVGKLEGIVDFPARVCRVAELAGVAPQPIEEESPKAKRGPIVATYDYVDAAGKLIYQVCRHEPGTDGKKKDFLQRQPDGRGGWIYKMEGVSLLPYRLPAVIASQTIWCPEGEKDCHTLESLGLTATTNSGGVNKWPEDGFRDILAGKTIVVIADNDEPGRKLAALKAQTLSAVATVRMVALPGQFKDVTEYVAAGHTRADLEALVSDIEATSQKSPNPPDLLVGFEPEDVGNAQRFRAMHGEDFLYSPSMGCWLEWQDGNHWGKDEIEVVRKLAHTTITEFALQAVRVNDEPLTKFAVGSRRSARITNMLREAQPLLPVRQQDLDADPWLFNVVNGTLDLRTGQLRPHRRSDLITKLAPVIYRKGARSELWEECLHQWTGGNKELQGFLQRAVGYSLSGDVSEEVLFFVHGPTAAGKSSFLEAIKARLGDYARTTDFETFVHKKESGIRNDIAGLAGRRFVVSIEVDKGKRLAEGLVKMVTGGDTVSARFLHKEFFEFVPQFKLWLAANDAPRVNDDDSAMWRRILRIPFDHVIPDNERDPTVKVRLKESDECGSAILSWAVEGCLQWREKRLKVPAIIRQATEQYQSDMDPLRDFFADVCTFGDNSKVTVARLREAYDAWCRQNGESHALDSKEFAARLQAKGCKPLMMKILGKTARGWSGIGVPDVSTEA